MKFGEEIISRTISKLLSGCDYREEIINAVNAEFFDFSIKFFRQIVRAKFDSQKINIDWYKNFFIESDLFTPDEKIIYAGLNRKTITNIYGTSSQKIMIDAARDNLDYLCGILAELEKDSNDGLAISIQISYNDITVNLSLIESMLVINALATKKLQLRHLAGVPPESIDNAVLV